MSRNYAVVVEAKGIPLKKLREMMVKGFGWEEKDAGEYRGVVHFEGEGYLCGGESEEHAHEAISKALKESYPKAKVMTKWTYLEDRPYSAYGDVLQYDR